MKQKNKKKFAWIIYLDKDDGNREDWNVFYTYSEVWLDEELAKKRKKFLKNNAKPGFEPYLTKVPLFNILNNIIPKQ